MKLADTGPKKFSSVIGLGIVRRQDVFPQSNMALWLAYITNIKE
jgi:hypothetical protein